jgi:integrase
MADDGLKRSQSGQLQQAGKAANVAAARHVFRDYQQRRAYHTLRRQYADLALFMDYLAELNIPCGPLFDDPEAWRGISWGLVEGFKQWMLGLGYAIGTVNVRLSTIKNYAKLAARAGTVELTEYALIKTVSGYSHREKAHIDEKRDEAGIRTRVGGKKAHATSIAPWQAYALKNSQPDSPQGRRDALLMGFLLDHGLRCGEMAALRADAVDLDQGLLTFYRRKVDLEQTHRLSPDTLRAAHAYFALGDAPDTGLLLRASKKNGQLTAAGMSERAITRRVNILGKRLGILRLSAHDCRHHWATDAAQSGTDMIVLMQAGGWNSPAMPVRYIEAAQIANEGIRQSGPIRESE